MAVEKTLSIIKPDAVERNLVGTILHRFEGSGLTILATRMRHLSVTEAEGFYAVHKARPFFQSLVSYMTSGPVVVSVLSGENAIQHHRDVLGTTNPTEAAEGTIRKDFGLNIEKNSCHGSDAPQTAAFEISYFFSGTEVFPRA